MSKIRTTKKKKCFQQPGLPHLARPIGAAVNQSSLSFVIRNAFPSRVSPNEAKRQQAAARPHPSLAASSAPLAFVPSRSSCACVRLVPFTRKTIFCHPFVLGFEHGIYVLQQRDVAVTRAVFLCVRVSCAYYKKNDNLPSLCFGF